MNESNHHFNCWNSAFSLGRLMRVNFVKLRLKDDELELVAFDESGKKGTNWRGKDWGGGKDRERNNEKIIPR